MNCKLSIGLITIFVIAANAFPAPQNGLGPREEQGVDPGLASERPAPPFNFINNHQGFGIGAAAGIGGVGASAGLGSFSVDPKSDPFLPFGAFAGINLPNQGGRIGAGCTALNCGVQFGELVLQVPNFLAAAAQLQNLTRPLSQQNSEFADAVGVPSSSSTANDDNNAEDEIDIRNGSATIPILRTRNDNLNTNNRQTVDPGSNFFRTLFGGLRDFRTTLAGFFREPASQTQRTPQVVTTADFATTTPASASSTTTSGATRPTTTQSVSAAPEARENEVA